MLYSVDSLFNISLNFVVKYINLVENFVGFPSLVAEEIFKRFVSEYNTESGSIQDILKKFVEAYDSAILERLNLSKRLLILNEHFESIVIVARYVTELCVCSCFLGENHEIYSYICEFERLKNLCLKDNSMNDSSVRLLTLRTRIFGIGGKEIEYLNLAGNHFTDDMIRWLSAFPKLNYLILSGSKISKDGVQILNSRYNLRQILKSEDHKDVVSEGWAAILLEKWIEEEKQNMIKKEKKLFFKRSIAATVKFTPCVSLGISLVFKKVLPLKDLEQQLVPPVKKAKLCINCDEKEIEEDIFSQYRGKS